MKFPSVDLNAVSCHLSMLLCEQFVQAVNRMLVCFNHFLIKIIGVCLSSPFGR